MRLPNRWAMPLAAAAAWLATATPAAAQAPRDQVRRATEGAAPVPATLAAVAWLVGYWIGAMPEGPVEQIFLPAAVGQMPSFVRATDADGILFYEISNIVARDGTIFLRLRHFTPELVGWEDGSGPSERPLVAREAGNLYFDRASFVRTGADSYTVYFLNMDGEREGETLVVPFRRVGPVPASPAHHAD